MSYTYTTFKSSILYSPLWIEFAYVMFSSLSKFHCITQQILQNQMYGGIGGVTAGCRTCDREVVDSTLGRVIIKWLLFEWMTVFRQVNHPAI